MDILLIYFVLHFRRAAWTSAICLKATETGSRQGRCKRKMIWTPNTDTTAPYGRIRGSNHTDVRTTKVHLPEKGIVIAVINWQQTTWALQTPNTSVSGSRSTCWRALYIKLGCHICSVHTQAAQWPADPKLMRRGTHGVNAPTGCWLSSPQASDACCLCLAAVLVEEPGPYYACHCHVFALLSTAADATQPPSPSTPTLLASLRAPPPPTGPSRSALMKSN